MKYDYICDKCSQERGLLDLLQTGCLTGSADKQKSISIHISRNSRKPVNGVFLETSLNTYELRGRQIGESGIVEIEPGGNMNAYFRFNQKIGDLQFYGLTSGNTNLGKAVLINDSEHVHWFPATGLAACVSYCLVCGCRIADEPNASFFS